MAAPVPGPTDPPTLSPDGIAARHARTPATSYPSATSPAGDPVLGRRHAQHDRVPDNFQQFIQRRAGKRRDIVSFLKLPVVAVTANYWIDYPAADSWNGIYGIVTAEPASAAADALALLASWTATNEQPADLAPKRVARQGS
jgi:hypothetical protein